MFNTLDEYYYTPSHPASFGGAKSLKRELKKDKKLPLLEETDDWLTGQDAYTLHKPIKRKFTRRKTIVSGPDQQIQSDLVDVKSHAKDNDNYKYLLTCIDVFSKKAWAFPVINKTGGEVAKALDKLFRQTDAKTLQTDKGTEFKNAEVRKVLETHNVRHFTTENENIKASIVERWNKTLRNSLHRYFTKTNRNRYVDALEDMVSAYNNRFHESIQMAPNDVDPTNVEDIFLRLYDPLEAFLKPSPKLRVGDHVRMSKARSAFQRGYTPNWSVEIFTVSKVIPTTPTTYRVVDWSSEPIEGTFYSEELQKVKKPETYQIEEILDRKTVGRRKMVLVKWFGYPDTFNQWIPESDVVDIE